MNQGPMGPPGGPMYGQPGAMHGQPGPPPQAARETLIRLTNVAKTYTRGSESLPILKDLNLEIERGAYEALMGPSGSGKSTLLNLMGGLDLPTSGSIEVCGQRLETMGQNELAGWRSRNIGFIFQAYHLLPVLTAVENVELPLLLTNLGSSDRRRRSEMALRIVGLGERMGHYPNLLSGGQQQRVAIARAIVNDPMLIVADEPTGDLDRETADEILALIEKLNRELGKTIVMVTHDPAAAERAHRTRHMDKGSLR